MTTIAAKETPEHWRRVRLTKVGNSFSVRMFMTDMEFSAKDKAVFGLENLETECIGLAQAKAAGEKWEEKLNPNYGGKVKKKTARKSK